MVLLLALWCWCGCGGGGGGGGVVGDGYNQCPIRVKVGVKIRSEQG